MFDAVVIGAGPVGLATAMLLARDGYEVTVLEQDAQPPPQEPDEVWANWDRAGVAQFRQPHLLLPRARHVLDAELPAVRYRIEQLGGRRFHLIDLLPRSLPDRSRRPDDARFETVAARRPLIEAALGWAAERTAGVAIRRGVTVRGPVAGPPALPGVPHVCGVLTASGEELRADVIVDAMGRRSKLGRWIDELGGRAPEEEASDAGFAYYTRHFRSRDGSVPEHLGPVGVDLATVRLLTLQADNGCWTVAVIPMAGDLPFKQLRHNDVWTKVVAAFPHAAHWLDGEPLCDVLPVAGVLDRRRRIVVDGTPVVTGLLPVGDAWACTNPTAGRGISLGLAHALALRDALRAEPDDPAARIGHFDDVTETTLTPWYQDQVERDRLRAADTAAVIEGRPPAEPSARQRALAAFVAGAAADAEIARGWLDTLACLALPAEVTRRPGISERIEAFAGQVPPPFPGPTRADLLTVLAAHRTA
ncbi:MAG: FAD-dependent oxidoreductase [Solirubrobacteraceae bacterium]